MVSVNTYIHMGQCVCVNVLCAVWYIVAALQMVVAGAVWAGSGWRLYVQLVLHM